MTQPKPKRSIVEDLQGRVLIKASRERLFTHVKPGSRPSPIKVLSMNAQGDKFSAVIQARSGVTYKVPFLLGNSDPILFCRAATKTVFLNARDMALKPADNPWMFMPGGDHTITPGAGEGSAQVTIRVDQSTATILDESLRALNETHTPHRAYFDKEHDEGAGATSWPLHFFWSDTPEPGVYVTHQVTEMGRRLVEGRTMRAFSPSFYTDAALPKHVPRGKHIIIEAGKRGSKDNPARVKGLVFPASGTLTNNPAFRKILPIWS